MSTKESILSRYKKHIREQFDMPSLDDIKGITYPDPLVQFIKMSESVGGQVIEVAEGRDINTLIKELYPDAKEIASNLPEITIATRNPDTIESAQALNGTDVGIIRGKFGVAENACIWIPQPSCCRRVRLSTICTRPTSVLSSTRLTTATAPLSVAPRRRPT